MCFIRKKNVFTNEYVLSVLCHHTVSSMKIYCFVFLASLSFFPGTAPPLSLFLELSFLPASDLAIFSRNALFSHDTAPPSSPA